VRIIDPGHRYALATLDGVLDQELTFVKREGANYPGNVGSHPGTTMQEVLRVLIDRCAYVNAQRPCDENRQVIASLRSALHVLELRAARAHGLSSASLQSDGIELLDTCVTCGHIVCQHGDRSNDAIQQRVQAAVRCHHPNDAR